MTYSIFEINEIRINENYSLIFNSNENLSLNELLKELENEIKKYNPLLINIFKEIINNKEYSIVKIKNSENSEIFFVKFTEEEEEFLKSIQEKKYKNLNLDLNLKNKTCMSFRRGTSKKLYLENKKLDSFKNGDTYIIKIAEIRALFLDTISFKYSFCVDTSGTKYIFENPYEILKSVRFKKGRKEERFLYKNLQLKDIESDCFTKFIFKVYFKELSENNFFVKDILKDFIENPNKIYVPIDFKLLEKSSNKKQLLEIKFKKIKNIHFYNRFNRISLSTSYSLLKSFKFINENEISKINNYEYDDFKDKEKFRVRDFFKNYFLSKIKRNNEEEEKEIENILDDYLNMSFKLKEKLTLDISNYNTLIKVHNKTSEKYTKEYYKTQKVIIKKDNPFLKLKLPKDFKMLKTSKDFFIEGNTNKNCVLSYIPKVNERKCMIYSLLKDNKKYTIEIIKRRGKFLLNQISGFANSPAPTDIREYVNEAIKIGNERSDLNVN